MQLHWKRIVPALIISLLLLAGLLLVSPLITIAGSVDEQQQKLDKLENKIEKKRNSHSEIQDKISIYKENLKAKRQEKTSLSNEIEILDQNISLTKKEISRTKNEIETLGLEIDEHEIIINEAEDDIDDSQDDISLLVRDLYFYSGQTNLERLLTHNTLSDVSAEIEYTETINNEFKDGLIELKDLKRELKKEKQELSEQKEQEEDKEAELEIRETSLGGQKTHKNDLLVEVGDDEEKFAKLLDEIKAEQTEINGEISSLEKSARRTLDELNKQKQANQPDDQKTDNTNTTIIPPTEFNPDWPVRGIITTYFRDPNYIFRSAFEHDAIDIAAPQGTALKAADSGVVSIVRFDGSTNYAYITIVHADNYSTIYGHINAAYVEPGEFVEKGQTIAAIGGLPGTTGAGFYTTGPHVHFGVRLNSIPVDPLLYLPQ